jgi:glutamine cyclotransferase
MKKYFHSLAGLALLGAMISCGSNKNSDTSRNEATPEQTQKKETYREVTTLSTDEPDVLHTIGKTMRFRLHWPDTVTIDSMKTYANAQLQETLQEADSSLQVSTSGLPVGTSTFKFEAFLSNGHKETHYRSFRFKSDIKPRQLKCRVEKTYPHDPTAFTQGLYYENGYLYEGTGQRGRSSLRKVELETGEMIGSLALPAEYFGEGITGFHDKIIQLTWTSRTGFIYDKQDFRLINKVRYPTQGWGITTDGDKLFMSDGTATIYLLSPNFNETGRIKVYDNQGPVKNLNELEYINGKIYANVYQQNYIISFNPENGKVLEKIDCSHLVPDKFKNSLEYVLNGIAWDEENQRMFLTGKHWDTIYQVTLDG